MYWFNNLMKLTIVNLSKAANLSSCVAADFSKASCFLIRASTASSDSCKSTQKNSLVYLQFYIFFSPTLQHSTVSEFNSDTSSTLMRKYI